MLVAIFYQQLPIQIVVADPVADSKYRFELATGQLVASCRFEKKLLLPSFVSRMLVAIFKQRLPIQIVVADSVANSKTKV